LRPFTNFFFLIFLFFLFTLPLEFSGFHSFGFSGQAPAFLAAKDWHERIWEAD